MIPVLMEVACNHAGDPQRFERYVQIAKKSSCNNIKIQIFDVNSLCHQSYKFTKDLASVQLTYSTIADIVSLVTRSGIHVWLEPFDTSSLAFALDLATQFSLSIKIPSCDVLSIQLSKLTPFKTVAVATGGLSIPELELIVPELSSLTNPLLIHGYQAFPTTLSDSNLGRMTFISSHFGLPIGYADHTPSTDYSEVLSICRQSVESGATLIERHICLSYEDQYDTVSASSPDHFSELLGDLSTISSPPPPPQQLLEPPMSPSELSYRQNMLKYLCVTRHISIGTPLSRHNTSLMRASTSLDYNSVPKLYNSSNLIALRDLPPGTLVSTNDVRQEV